MKTIPTTEFLYGQEICYNWKFASDISCKVCDGQFKLCDNYVKNKDVYDAINNNDAKDYTCIIERIINKR